MQYTFTPRWPKPFRAPLPNYSRFRAGRPGAFDIKTEPNHADAGGDALALLYFAIRPETIAEVARKSGNHEVGARVQYNGKTAEKCKLQHDVTLTGRHELR